MAPDRPIDDLVQRALELDDEERASLVATLTAHDGVGGLPLAEEATVAVTPSSGSGSTDGRGAGGGGRDEEATFDLAGRRLGAYRVIRSLGRGGMGEVFLAERADGAFEGRVALKVVRPGGDEEILDRFRAERQTLANLEHPHIARMLDAGTTEEGRPYLVMEHVDGQRIDRFCTERELDLDDRLAIFLDVCEAVEHAHRNLIVHRDLKPDNILVSAPSTTTTGSGLNARGEVKLLDFGIAKLLPGAASEDVAVQTHTGKAAMSLQYASPEQLAGEPITTATDVHALGLLLYELLTGHHPYRAPTDSAIATGKAILDREAQPPSRAVTEPFAGLSADRLKRRLAGDLDTITLTALRKDPERRYSSVERLAEDIRRHLEGRPVAARPDTLGYRAMKFVRRHKLGVAAAGLLLLSILAGVSATLWQARIAEQRADDIRALAGSLIFEVDDLIRDLPGSTPAREQIVSRALTYLDRLAAESGDDPGLERELARAYLRVGNIQGNPFSANLGDTEGALASYQKALDLAEKARAALSDDPEAARTVAVVQEKLGDTRAWSGDLEGAEAAAASALETFHTLARNDPENRRHRFSHGISLVKMGDLEGNPDFPNLDRPDAALASYRSARAIFDDLAADDPDDVGVQRYRGLTRERLGTVLLAVGDPTAAAEAYRESLELRQALADGQPASTQMRRDVAVAHEKLGDVLLEAGQGDLALDQTTRSFEIFRDLAAADPLNAAAQRSLSISHRKLAEVLSQTGRTEDAIDEYRASRALLVELESASGGNATYQEELAAIDERLEELGRTPSAQE